MNDVPPRWLIPGGGKSHSGSSHFNDGGIFPSSTTEGKAMKKLTIRSTETVKTGTWLWALP